ncbi:hypothetical protein [Frigoribacterium sp. PvP032]|uniref:hypothetical protein n=1 Tax=Frigoribacterium sp. PvP032 TaxID=2806589 RepID=UPI001AE83FB4|nr:hypothetical protein [Frigoribacterium sp. PvP032]MBP1190429.1 hypothetical protein [Frigoribacterium sp. PvP032]
MKVRGTETPRASSLGSRLRLVAVSSGIGTGGKLLQFAALAFLATQLTPAEYGRFSILQILLFGIASIASSSFAFAANTRAADIVSANAGVEFSTVLRAVALGKLPVYAGIAIAGAVVFPLLYLVLSGGLVPTPFVFALGATCSAIVVTDTFIGVVAGTGRVVPSALLDGARGAGSAIALAVAVLLFSSDWTALGLVVVDLVIATVGISMMSTRTSARRVTSLIVPRASKGVIRAGVAANAAAQLGTWALVWAVQVVGGLGAVGAFSLANRFATLVLLAPGFLSKNMLGALRRDRPTGEDRGKSLLFFYVATVSAGSLAAAVLAVAIGLSFPAFRGNYPGLDELLIVLSGAAVLRAVATSLGIICVSRDLLKTWVLSDAAALLVLLISITFALVSAADIGLLLTGLVISNATALIWRAGGLFLSRRASSSSPEADRLAA